MVSILALNHLSMVGSQPTLSNFSALVTMQEKDIRVTVYYFEGEEEWGQHIFRMTTDVLPILEELVGFPYTHNFDVVIYPKTGKETSLWNAQNMMGGGIWINREEFTPEKITTWSYTAVIIHENVHYWSNNAIFEKPWLKEGYAELLTYIALQQMGREIDAIHKKNDWIKTVKENGYYNIPLDLFEYETNGPGNETTLLAYSKSALFCLEIYERYGIEPIQKINEYLHTNAMAVDSLGYMNLLEEHTGEDQEELFKEWVFPKNLDITAWENAEGRISELEEMVDSSLSSISEMYGFHKITDFIDFHMHIHNQITMVQSYIEDHDFVKAIEIIMREIEETRSKMQEFHGHAQTYFEAENFYDSLTSLYQGMPETRLLPVKEALLSLDYDHFTEQITEFYEEMENLTTYEAFFIEECQIEDCISPVSLDSLLSHMSYEEVMMRLDETLGVLQQYSVMEGDLREIDRATGLGLMLIGVGKNHCIQEMEEAHKELVNGNSREAQNILVSVRGVLLRGRQIGVVFLLGGMLVISSILLISVYMLKHKHENHDKKIQES
ncbi:MAG: hypothetical protein HXS53_04715 [Theionarchaea archaeon]|nr:hypothetical protein [Theionarchaea archaeon]